jgi:hypothetical protein
VPSFPGDGLGVEHAAGRQPDQDVDRAAGQAVSEGGGAVAGVEDEQRRRLHAVPGSVQAAQHVLHLRDRLRRAGRGHGARHVHESGPRGAQVAGRGGELVLPAGRGLAGPFAVAGAVVHVLPARRAPRVRPRVGGRVDREPQAAPPGARVPDLPGILRRQPGQRRLQQPAVDDVMPRDPRPRLRAVHGLRQLRRQQGEQPLVVGPPGGKRVVQRAVAAGKLRLQAQLHQRRHRVIRAQHRVGQLEQRVRPRVQALVQRLPELPQPLQRLVPRNGAGEDRRVRSRRQGRPGYRKRLQPGTGPWQGRRQRPFPFCDVGCVATPSIRGTAVPRSPVGYMSE